MRSYALLAAVLVVAACNRHVNGSRYVEPATCTGNWVATVNNTTNRYYDLYVGSRLVGTAEPRMTSRAVLDPALGRVTPTLREAAVSRSQSGPHLTSGALRMTCE